MLGESLIGQYTIRSKILSDLIRLRVIGESSAEEAGATIYGKTVSYKDTEGNCHILVPLGESHIAIHSDVSRGILNLDIFTCRGLRARDIKKEMSRYMMLDRGHEIYFPRGEPYEEKPL